MELLAGDLIIWLAIALCVSQSAMFSGLNLAMFSLSRLRLEVEVSSGNQGAAKILALREDSNFLLTTVLWGNVGVNVVLTLLSDSVLTGVSAFFFSTIIITVFGEIGPQAYFSRNALRVATLLVPVLRFYQIVLYPLAKPTALVLDQWLGKESIQYFREHNFRELIRKHVEAPDAELDRLEALGALNFLAIDDLPVASEGEVLDPLAVISIPFDGTTPNFPDFAPEPGDPFLTKIAASEKQWIIVTDRRGAPRLALDSDAFLRCVLFRGERANAAEFCHAPIIVASKTAPLGTVLGRLRVGSSEPGANVIKNDVILIWSDEHKRVITGPDILGRLMQGIAVQENRAQRSAALAPA